MWATCWDKFRIPDFPVPQKWSHDQLLTLLACNLISHCLQVLKRKTLNCQATQLSKTNTKMKCFPGPGHTVGISRDKNSLEEDKGEKAEVLWQLAAKQWYCIWKIFTDLKHILQNWC